MRCSRILAILCFSFWLTFFLLRAALAAPLTTTVLITLTPAPPSNLSTLAISSSQINLSWSDNSNNEDGFLIERKIGSSGTYAQVATTSADIATYSDTALAAVTTYYYRIAAFNSDGNSAYSNEASGTTQSAGGGGVSIGGGGRNSGGGFGGYTPTVQTAAVFKGTAYPLSSITLLKDGQIVATTKADADAKFEISLTGLEPATYNFGIWAEGTNDLRSILHTFAIPIAAGATTVISNIFIPPTIALDKTEVRKGDPLLIFGDAAPQAMVHIVSDPSLKVSIPDVRANEAGVWQYTLDTQAIDYGGYDIRVRATEGDATTTFSQVLHVEIGSKNVESITSIASRADINNDGKVNLVDFSIFAYWYGRPLEKNVETRVDLNGDGKLNLIDFSILAYYWTG